MYIHTVHGITVYKRVLQITTLCAAMTHLQCFTLSDNFLFICLFIGVVCFQPLYCELIKGRDQVVFVSIGSPVPGVDGVPGRVCCMNE